MLAQPETLTRLARRSYEANHADGVAVVTPADEYAALQRKLASKEQELQNLTLRSAGLAPGDPGLAGYDLAIAALGSEVAALRDECERARGKAAKYERVERVVGQWREYLAMWSDNVDYLSGANFPPAQRRQWLEALQARVFLHRREVGRPLATLRLHLTLLDRGGAAQDGDAVAAFPVLPAPLPQLTDPNRYYDGGPITTLEVALVEEGEGENRRVVVKRVEGEAAQGESEKDSCSRESAASQAWS